MLRNIITEQPGLSRVFCKEISLELFKKICLCRSFELKVKAAYDKKLIPPPIYLSLGQESIAAALSISFPNAFQFAQHRCHDIYLCYGGSPEKLRDELLGLPTGCASGMGGSASIHSPDTRMFGHDGHMGTQVKIGVGYALGSNNKTLVIMGDASAEEGFVLGAIGEAASKKAPVLFVCADNNLSILTQVSVRRNWSMIDEARAKGMPAENIIDDPWLIMDHVEKLKNKLPAFLNIHTCRELWHAGTGSDGPPDWNRFELIKKELVLLKLGEEMAEIEQSIAENVNNLWKHVLYPNKMEV